MRKGISVISGLLLFSGIASGVSLPDSPIGFASLNGGTDGGKGGATHTVSTGNDLQALLKKGASGLIIYINGTITPSNSPSEGKINVKEVKDISIVGSGTKGIFDGIGIKITKASNIILQNLVIHHVKAGEKDCISIEGPVNNVWIDHCEIYNDLDNGKDYYDGLLDAKDDAEYITVSRCYFHHGYKAVLVGSGSGDTYDRKMTFHHNYFLNCNSRLPSYRGGTGHVFNSLFASTIAGIGPTGVNSRVGARLRIEGNCFRNIGSGSVDDDGDLHCEEGPIGAYYDPPGFWDVKDNSFINCKGSRPTASTCSFNPPYQYTLLKASETADNVFRDVGAEGSKPEIVSFETHAGFSPPRSLVSQPAVSISNGNFRVNPKCTGYFTFECYTVSGHTAVTFEGTVQSAALVIPTPRLSGGFYVVRTILNGVTGMHTIVIP